MLSIFPISTSAYKIFDGIFIQTLLFIYKKNKIGPNTVPGGIIFTFKLKACFLSKFSLTKSVR